MHREHVNSLLLAGPSKKTTKQNTVTVVRHMSKNEVVKMRFSIISLFFHSNQTVGL
jgi:hypothetical protein